MVSRGSIVKFQPPLVFPSCVRQQDRESTQTVHHIKNVSCNTPHRAAGVHEKRAKLVRLITADLPDAN